MNCVVSAISLSLIFEMMFAMSEMMTNMRVRSWTLLMRLRFCVSDNISWKSYEEKANEKLKPVWPASSRHSLISESVMSFPNSFGRDGKRMWLPGVAFCDLLLLRDICVLIRNRNLVSETVPANLWKSFDAICFCLKHTNSISEFHSK